MSSPETERDAHREFRSNTGTTMRLADLDFVTFYEHYELRDVANDPVLKLAIGLLDRYQALVDGNTSLVRHKDRDPSVLHGSNIEASLRKVFGSVEPCLVETKSEDDNPYPPLNWVVVVLEAKDSDMILQDDGTYKCSIRGQTIRLSEHQKGLIIPFRQFFEPWPQPQVVKKEMITVEQAIGDLWGYENALKTGK